MTRILFFDFNIPYLLADESKPVGGATVQTRHWLAGLSALGEQVGVLVDGFAGDIRPVPNFDIIHTFDMQVGVPYLNWVTYRYPRLNRVVQDYRPDYIYHAGAGFTSWVLASIAKRNGARFIYRVANDADTDDRIRQRLPAATRLFFEHSLKMTDVILCQNAHQFRNLVRRFPNKPITVFHNPYDFGNERPKVKPFSKRRYVAWLGIFQYQKNLPALYEVARQLPDIEFRIAGERQKQLDAETAQALQKLRTCGNVRFVGFKKRSEVREFLRDAYLLLSTSYYEGFSNVFLEALASGTPIVATEPIDPDSIIANNGLGSVCVHESDMPDAIRALLRDSTYYDTMIQWCQEYVAMAHNPKTLSRQLLDYLKRV